MFDSIEYYRLLENLCWGPVYWGRFIDFDEEILKDWPLENILFYILLSAYKHTVAYVALEINFHAFLQRIIQFFV